MFVSSLFYAALIFDMAGDGAHRAADIVWIPIIMILLGLLLGKNKIKLYTRTKTRVNSGVVDFVSIVKKTTGTGTGTSESRSVSHLTT